MQKIFIALIFLGISGIGFWWGGYTFSSHNPKENQATSHVPIGGPFRLKNLHGELIDSRTLKDKVLAIYFGYSYCPDICPTALSNLSKALQILDKDAERISPFFITVDPKRDTQEILSAYMQTFDPKIQALLGTEDEISFIKKEFRVYAEKSSTSGDEDDKGYLVDHSSLIYLVKPDGQYLGHFSHDTPPEEMAQRIRELIVF